MNSAQELYISCHVFFPQQHTPIQMEPAKFVPHVYLMKWTGLILIAAPQRCFRTWEFSFSSVQGSQYRGVTRLDNSSWLSDYSCPQTLKFDTFSGFWVQFGWGAGGQDSGIQG